MAVLESWFRGHHGWLLERVQRHLRNWAEAEDVASETFSQAAAIQAGNQGLNTVREPRAFLTTIAKRQIFQLWRRRDLEQAYLETLALQSAAMAPSVEERQLFIEALEGVAAALEGLSAKAQQAFLYSQLDGLTYGEIADKLGVSASMVRQYMAQAFRRMAGLNDVR
ncbi:MULTISPECIES: sigma-70 family RNA polymerase sigma factor [Achromobacter]|uniref:RNA polymerase sigma factor FecI n=2 Tax=Achromobacter piechaudii TaxID=72556 RepID=A0A6S7EB90_9BURK|nr:MULTISPECIES: sigma-70 family RNA polymerase sigma factor [Achromobacter]EFF76754.1 Sigma-70 region 2 [Achromobacter piechaudii ATCC 43553]KNY12403.1 RNA polymerase sigma factor [Achromobacter piechaudii]MPS78814.1 sigma-70 family RNA polymerase sigma factor [Achromobacter sp.]CAB3715103.1 putative RNA polymerase sigma factor FecI [Achromobacter piechaudii]CAB3881979.1 putative RNA polymerase sigma factor FecI [Achromobacter piechaudii]